MGNQRIVGGLRMVRREGIAVCSGMMSRMGRLKEEWRKEGERKWIIVRIDGTGDEEAG